MFATLDMHIRFTRPGVVNTRELTLEGSVNHRGKLPLRVSPCNIDNAEGKRLAMATSSALVVGGGARELREGTAAPRRSSRKPREARQVCADASVAQVIRSVERQAFRIVESAELSRSFDARECQL